MLRNDDDDVVAAVVAIKMKIESSFYSNSMSKVPILGILCIQFLIAAAAGGGVSCHSACTY